MTETKKSLKLPLIISLILVVIAVVFTIIVKSVDIGALESHCLCGSNEGSSELAITCAPVCEGENDAPVGLFSLNNSVRSSFSYDKTTGINKFWYSLTKISGILCFLPVAFFVILGFTQLTKRKSFKKVDPELKLLAVFYLAVAVLYLVFDHFYIVNYRPVFVDGVSEPSYPSSHTLFAITLCGSAIIVLHHLYKNNPLAILASVLLGALMIVTVVGRLLSGVHWFTDIIGGVLISCALLMVFYTATLTLSSRAKDKS